MPLRRVNRSKTKQKRKITTRLMEISLKLDEYIYKKKPISTAHAQAYINEISTYKAQCLKDERSLQVIEKLTRCMKSIVDQEQNEEECEQQQNTSTKITAYSCPSPTYSLVEEDIEPVAYNQDIQDTQVILQLKAGEANAKEATIDTIDLCAEEDNEREKTAFKIDVQMHRSLSNLSIRDTADVCSQSILDNFEPLNPRSSPNVEDRNYHVIQTAQIAFPWALTFASSTTTPSYEDGFIPHLVRSKCNNNEKSLIRIDKSSENNLKFVDLTVDENRCKKKEVNVKKVVRFESNINKEANRAAVTQEHNKNVIKTVSQTRKKNSKGNLKNQNNIETKKKPMRQVSKQKNTNKQNNVNSKQSLQLQTKTKLNGTNQNSTVVTKIDTAKTSCSTTMYDTMLLNKNVIKSTSNSAKNAGKHCTSKIYSNNTENDLSWMENIRFVREIQKEEVDTNLSGLNESFWEDLSLPNDWDEHEFDV